MNCASYRGGNCPSAQKTDLESVGIWGIRIAIATMLIVLAATSLPANAQERVLGTDISYWNCGTSAGGISQVNWNTAYSTGNRVFAFLRATRGGTTGLSQTDGTPGNPTQETLTLRY